MSESAICKEVERVKVLKRAIEAEASLLRSDMEQGKIHLRVSGDADFRKEVASAVVAMAHPGYSEMAQGSYFADPVEGKVYHRESQAAWSPWSNSIDWRIISVDELVNQEGNDFSPAIDNWGLALDDSGISLPQVLEAYARLEEDKEPRDENGDLKDWVWSLEDEAIAWAAQSEEFGKIIEKVENQAHEIAIEFALSEIKDEIVIEPFERY